MTGIQETYERHALELMTIGGVVGTAIGRTKAGDPCILVFVKSDQPGVREAIPSELDGYAVVVEVTGELGPY